ncbi:hypothetical protein [Formosa sp. Hel1_31_208]|uniref:hypothetical protein n=1 Tax=Formosa sp. Hel1_31_208 TaxID=1798225 RepID=UPI000B846FEC|nr:hypothetical protein [Formosa sp. Hel1_31_208]
MHTISAQNNVDLRSSYDNYVNLPREVAYAHLNKSLYVHGETIGFSVYVFDKNTKKPSSKTTNVYVVLSDDKNNTVKEQLIWAKGGKTSGVFYVDSLLASGNYTFKTFTNWMKNFDEQNYYTQSIKIINPNDVQNDPQVISAKLDAQFLPEGGHIVANTENSIGVVIKDVNGFGVSSVTGNILDQYGTIVTHFQTNAMGIGKFPLLHDIKNTYTVELEFNNDVQTFDLNFSEQKGINVILKELGSKVLLSFNTNKKTLPMLKNKAYSLFIHNGFKSKTSAITFTDATKLTKAIDKNDLYPGINIFTLFNENNQPILERLYFNYEGVETFKTSDATTRKEDNFLTVQIPLKGLNPNEIANLSVSILPATTKSYNTHHNMLSYTMLQPFVKGYIENAKYYFTDITDKKKFELDKLLITQGWSSYSWNDIFNNPPQQLFDFENGISFKANNNATKDEGKFVLHTTTNHDAQSYILKDGEQSFSESGFFIEDREYLEFTEVINDKKIKKANLYVQFSPSSVPKMDNFINALTIEDETTFEANTSDILFNRTWDEYELLDEVQLEAYVKKQRADKISKRFPTGRIDMFDDEKRYNTIDLVTYLNFQGYTAFQDIGGRVSIVRSRALGSPGIFLNGQRLFDLSILNRWDMSDMDYIVFDRTQRQYPNGGPISLAGTIHLYTNPNLKFKNDKRKLFNQRINLPLTFTSEKKFYAPKYVYYDTKFFKDYGVIDWIPNVEINSSNIMNLKFKDTGSEELKIFIEGTTNEGKLISEEKLVMMNGM